MPKKDIKFDLNKALEDLKAGKPMQGEDGFLTPSIKQLAEAALQTEQEQHLAADAGQNRKNGYTSKTIKSAAGSFELKAPRDRDGTFEPQLVKKHQTHLTDDLERKIMALFALGNSYQQIRGHIREIYGIELSNGTLNAVTDKLLPELESWRERDLDAVWVEGLPRKTHPVQNWNLTLSQLAIHLRCGQTHTWKFEFNLTQNFEQSQKVR